MLIVTSIVATGAGLHAAAFFIEQKAHIASVPVILAVAVPLVIFLGLLHGLYYFLVRRFHSIDAWLLISSAGVAMLAAMAALSGISIADVGEPQTRSRVPAHRASLLVRGPWLACTRSAVGRTDAAASRAATWAWDDCRKYAGEPTIAGP
ncbi:MAG TPA: hypothetical protein VH458_11200 [Vicinamibacterales bacterium]